MRQQSEYGLQDGHDKPRELPSSQHQNGIQTLHHHLTFLTHSRQLY